LRDREARTLEQGLKGPAGDDVATVVEHQADYLKHAALLLDFP
jgi:hypothetical protein